MSSSESRVTQNGTTTHESDRPRRHGLDPVDVSLAAYLVASGLLLLVRDPGAGHYVPLAFRVAFLAVLYFLGRQPLPAGRAWELARRAYPIAIYPYLYAELATLNQLVTHEHYDAIVLRWEAFVFGSQPSIRLREWLPWKPLSELLHLGYFSYYLIPTFTLIVLATKRKMLAISETMTAVTLTFVVCYAFFILFPVVGPYHTFIPPDPHALGSVFPRVTHAIVRAGSSHGTAFPSSHVAVALAVFLQALRHDRFAACVLVGFVPALIVGTVYGGFHYGVDALAGIVVGTAVHVLNRVVFPRLEAWRRRSVGEPVDQRVAVSRRS